MFESVHADLLFTTPANIHRKFEEYLLCETTGTDFMLQEAL